MSGGIYEQVVYELANEVIPTDEFEDGVVVRWIKLEDIGERVNALFDKPDLQWKGR